VSDAIVAALSADLGRELVGIIFYGSRLNQTAGPRSDWDFFVIVESYGGVHRSWLHARLNSVLPPSVYRREVVLPDGSTAACKLSYVSVEDLDRYTSSGAPDSYLFGRLSKRVALVFARDENTRDRMVDALARSAVLCATWALAEAVEGLPVAQLARESVAFSYRCEERVESATRPQKLFGADVEHFRTMYEGALTALVARGRVGVDADSSKTCLDPRTLAGSI
jgi:predicted nucleotidyltransferase